MVRSIELYGLTWIISKVRPIEGEIQNPKTLALLKERGIVSKVWVRKVRGSRLYHLYKTDTGSYVS